MKRAMLFGFIILFLATCRKSSNNDLTASQLQAVNLMKQSYASAKIYNDSLILCHTDTLAYPVSMKYFYDGMYHKYVNAFDSCHTIYNHDINSANHSHNSQGMQMHTSMGMMSNQCNCCDNGGHDASIHDSMDDLNSKHLAYHPN